MASLANPKAKLKIEKVPTEFVLDNGPSKLVDFSDVTIKQTGRPEAITLMVSSTTGTFNVIGDENVSVEDNGTDSVRLTGTARNIQRLLDKAETVTFVSDPEAPVDGTGGISLSAELGGEVFAAATTTAIVSTATPKPTTISGTSVSDFLEGDNAGNIILGFGGNDLLIGFGGDDDIRGNAGWDTIQGDEGSDTLNGGSGQDTLRYFGSNGAVTVDLNVNAAGFQSAAGGHAQGDIISEFENVYATNFADTLIGDAGKNILFGYGGTDTIDGGAGDDVIRGGRNADVLIGGAGSDWLRYLGSRTGVNVDLNLDASGFHQVSGGDAQGDVAFGFENVFGSNHADVLMGDANANSFIGYNGADVIDAGAGNDYVRGGKGADILSGGDGIDWLEYKGSEGGVTINLGLITAQVSGGDASGDVLDGFENVSGTGFADVLIGSDERNFLYGLGGDDIIEGGVGYDVIRGGTGADTMSGGEGSDVLHYGGATSGVTVNLSVDASGFQQAWGGDADGDVISGFEHVYATNFADTLTGDDIRNVLVSYDGDDVLNGGAGKDSLRGGNGADTFVFNTALGDSNVDNIVDFVVADDVIALGSAVFAGLVAGQLNANQFASNATGGAETADQRIIYDNAGGVLYFDADGSGAAVAVRFTTLTAGLTMDETDFIIV